MGDRMRGRTFEVCLSLDGRRLELMWNSFFFFFYLLEKRRLDIDLNLSFPAILKIDIFGGLILEGEMNKLEWKNVCWKSGINLQLLINKVTIRS